MESQNLFVIYLFIQSFMHVQNVSDNSTIYLVYIIVITNIVLRVCESEK